tara:strand:+ start:2057 stop:2344 length:288 start_codon:yes stop_codon:yes gene_type:complete
MKNTKLILMAEGAQAVHRLMRENARDIGTLADIMTPQIAEQFLASYMGRVYEEAQTTENLFTSDAPVHEGRQSIHDVHVVDGMYIQQDALDAILY